MVYITGDLHGEIFRVSETIAQHAVTPYDIIVLLGDPRSNCSHSKPHKAFPEYSGRHSLQSWANTHTKFTGESVNGFVRRAIFEAIERDKAKLE